MAYDFYHSGSDFKPHECVSQSKNLNSKIFNSEKEVECRHRFLNHKEEIYNFGKQRNWELEKIGKVRDIIIALNSPFFKRG